MKRHTSNHLVALVLLALLMPALAYGGGWAKADYGQPGSRGVRIELAFRSEHRVDTAVLSFETSPVELLTPAWLTSNSCPRSRGVIHSLRRALVLVRALGKAAWAIVKQQAGERDPGTNGSEVSDADRR